MLEGSVGAERKVDNPCDGCDDLVARMRLSDGRQEYVMREGSEAGPPVPGQGYGLYGLACVDWTG